MAGDVVVIKAWGRAQHGNDGMPLQPFLQLFAKLDGAGAELDGPAANLDGCTTAGGGSGCVTAGGGSVHNAFRFISGANVGCCFTIRAAGVGGRLVGRVRKGKQVVVVVGGGGGRGGGCEQQ